VLARIATDAKSNEITAVPKLLAMLRLKGTIVTADALNCQRAIAQQIVDQGGDYALALTGNQGTLHDDVVLYLDDPASKAIAAKPAVEADHGRIETRTATVSTDIAWLIKDHQMAGPGRCRQGRAHPRNPRQDNVRDRLLSAQRGADARTLQRSRSRPLGRRKPAALAARCHHERGSGPEPFGKVPTISPFSATWR
jgi:predicted transposase YbfD/YdcC